MKSFSTQKERGARLANALPPLFILMTLASPVVWEHHGIFVALSFLLLLKRLDTPNEWIWFGFAYFLEFVLPTFDFFPWSVRTIVRTAHHLMADVESNQETKPVAFLYRFQRLVE